LTYGDTQNFCSKLISNIGLLIHLFLTKHHIIFIDTLGWPSIDLLKNPINTTPLATKVHTNTHTHSLTRHCWPPIQASLFIIIFYRLNKLIMHPRVAFATAAQQQQQQLIH